MNDLLIILLLPWLADHYLNDLQKAGRNDSHTNNHFNIYLIPTLNNSMQSYLKVVFVVGIMRHKVKGTV